MEGLPQTILLVDDNDDVLDVITKMLGAHRTVHVASGGHQAIQLFRVHHTQIDCVILDMIMPNLNGMETFTHLRTIRADIPVLFMSGYCTERISLDSTQTAACGFITKPFRRRDLFTHLQRLLSQP